MFVKQTQNGLILAFTEFGHFGTIPPRFLASTAAAIAEGASQTKAFQRTKCPIMDDLVHSKEC